MVETKKILKIILIEEEREARDVYGQILKDAGFKYDEASDGGEAEEKLKQKKYDIVILDVFLPMKDGLEVLQDMKKEPDKFGTPRVILLTNVEGDFFKKRAFELGADMYLLKSLTEPEDLIEAINSLKN
ncbi:response regulator [Candidatus Dojkabacteria bacterium]|nr:response regulator [Candidatus Dojkabacteria bacterium]